MGLLVAATVSLFADEDLLINRVFSRPVSLGRERVQNHLIVPESFEGRSGRQVGDRFFLRLFEHLEISRGVTETHLQGRNSVFDLESESHDVRGLIWKSRLAVPGKAECIRCHSQEPGYSRMQVWTGQEKRLIRPETYWFRSSSITFDRADITKRYLKARYWTTPKQFWWGGVTKGAVRSGPEKRSAEAFFLEWNLEPSPKWSFASGVFYAKVAERPRHREFRGVASWRPWRRLKIGLRGGILLEGMDQFDLPFSDIGSVLLASELLAPEDLPAIYTRFREEKFAYYQISTEFAYEF